MRAVSPRAIASASGTTAGSWKGRAESLFAADMLACSLAPAGSAAHETIRMDVARAARAGTCLRIAGSFPTDVAFASRMGPWRDRSILDRKSVVSGQSVYVRVELGGRLTFINKTNKHTRT